MANDKLHKFIQSALTNPLHPVFQFRATNPILKHYAVNVNMGGQGLLETITPDQWEQDYPQARDTMLEVMRLCEEDGASEAAESKLAQEKADLEGKLKEAQDALAAKDAEIAQLKAAQPAE